MLQILIRKLSILIHKYENLHKSDKLLEKVKLHKMTQREIELLNSQFNSESQFEF